MKKKTNRTKKYNKDVITPDLACAKLLNPLNQGVATLNDSSNVLLESLNPKLNLTDYTLPLLKTSELATNTIKDNFLLTNQSAQVPLAHLSNILSESVLQGISMTKRSKNGSNDKTKLCKSSQTKIKLTKTFF